MDDRSLVDLIDGGQDALREFLFGDNALWRSTERASLEKKPSMRFNCERLDFRFQLLSRESQRAIHGAAASLARGKFEAALRLSSLSIGKEVLERYHDASRSTNQLNEAIQHCSQKESR